MLSGDLIGKSKAPYYIIRAKNSKKKALQLVSISAFQHFSISALQHFSTSALQLLSEVLKR